MEPFYLTKERYSLLIQQTPREIANEIMNRIHNFKVYFDLRPGGLTRLEDLLDKLVVLAAHRDLDLLRKEFIICDYRLRLENRSFVPPEVALGHLGQFQVSVGDVVDVYFPHRFRRRRCNSVRYRRNGAACRAFVRV